MRIWFNRWFSTSYHYINLIKNNPDNIPFEVYGTYPDLNSVYLQVCDHVEVEPAVTGREYIDFCLDFCKRNKIDIFIPRLHMITISEHLQDFNNIGTKVLVCEDTELLRTIADKAKFYELCKETNFMTLPEYHVVNTVEQFKEAYKDLDSKGLRVCFKPVRGEGGAGFRVINEAVNSLDSLYGPINHRISLEQTITILSGQETFPDLMVLEFLDGNEYSIDCLAYEGKLLAAVPRVKLGGRIQLLEDNEEMLNIAHHVAERYRLPYVFNVQLKSRDGVPKLLEINPRMSGGLHMASFTGVNFPYYAIKLLLEGIIEVPKPTLNLTVSYVEDAVLMKNVDKLFTI